MSLPLAQIVAAHPPTARELPLVQDRAAPTVPPPSASDTIVVVSCVRRLLNWSCTWMMGCWIGGDLEPNKVDLLNNLAASLSLQGREAEATLLMEVLHYQHPDYLFARTGLAKAAMRKGDLQQAQALLEPLYERRKFHVSEYDALCATQIDLLLLQNDPISAKTWFKMWEACNPENPRLNPYRILFKSEVLEGDYVP